MMTVPTRRFRVSDFRTTIAAVLARRDLRGLAWRAACH